MRSDTTNRQIVHSDRTTDLLDTRSGRALAAFGSEAPRGAIGISAALGQEPEAKRVAAAFRRIFPDRQIINLLARYRSRRDWLARRDDDLSTLAGLVLLTVETKELGNGQVYELLSTLSRALPVIWFQGKVIWREPEYLAHRWPDFRVYPRADTWCTPDKIWLAQLPARPIALRTLQSQIIRLDRVTMAIDAALAVLSASRKPGDAVPRPRLVETYIDLAEIA